VIWLQQFSVQKILALCIQLSIVGKDYYFNLAMFNLAMAVS